MNLSINTGRMDDVKATFQHLLRGDSDASDAIWAITTREGLFHHINTVENNINGNYTYSLRINGALRSLDGFMQLVRNIITTGEKQCSDWEAMIWGSCGLALAVGLLLLLHIVSKAKY